MTPVTQLLATLDFSNPRAAEELLPLVYQELRQLAAAKLAQEKPGQTLQPTALVHEAYLRLVSQDVPQAWNSRGHFFAAAAEAMRRILVEQARRKQSLKHGGNRVVQELISSELAVPLEDQRLLEVHEALDELAAQDAQAAEIVKLRFFIGLTSAQAAEVLGVSSRTADRLWVYAKSFLFRAVEQDHSN